MHFAHIGRWCFVVISCGHNFFLSTSRARDEIAFFRTYARTSLSQIVIHRSLSLDACECSGICQINLARPFFACGKYRRAFWSMTARVKRILVPPVAKITQMLMLSALLMGIDEFLKHIIYFSWPVMLKNNCSPREVFLLSSSFSLSISRLPKNFSK